MDSSDTQSKPPSLAKQIKTEKGPKWVIQWESKEAEEAILKACNDLQSKGFAEPTVRAVYYVMGSLGQIPLTNTGYKSLDAKIVRMRRDGAIPWGFFAVKRGTQIGNTVAVGIDGLYQARDLEAKLPEDKTVDFLVERLKKAADEYSLPRWWKQQDYVEVWVEKDGLLGALHSFVADLGVTVRAPQGYGAWEFVHESVKRIEVLMDQRFIDSGHVHIFYLGDLDPSGKDIPRFVRQEMLPHFGLDVHFHELALNVDQVTQFDLPEMPESAEVRAKIERDVRLKWYKETYSPDVFCELDAFLSLHTQEARDLVRSSVEALFDDSLEDARDEEEAEAKKKVKSLVKKAVTFKKPKKKSKPKESDPS